MISIKTFRQDKIGLFGGIYPVNRGIPFKPLAFSAPNYPDKPEPRETTSKSLTRIAADESYERS